MKIVFLEEIKKYVNLQCNNDLSLYEKFPELINTEDILKTLTPNKSLDIGSGIGRASVFLFKKFNWINTTFLLLDGNYGDKQVANIREKDNEFYNSLECTKLFCESNGLMNYRIYDAEKDEYLKEKDIDLVFSFLAIGFHWPIDFYLTKIYDNLSVGCTLIFGLRGIEAGTWINKQIDNIDKNKYKIVRFVLKPTKNRESVLILKKC
jgi:SAM-dependent methyltransferase